MKHSFLTSIVFLLLLAPICAGAEEERRGPNKEPPQNVLFTPNLTPRPQELVNEIKKERNTFWLMKKGLVAPKAEFLRRPREIVPSRVSAPTILEFRPADVSPSLNNFWQLKKGEVKASGGTRTAPAIPRNAERSGDTGHILDEHRSELKTMWEQRKAGTIDLSNVRRKRN